MGSTEDLHKIKTVDIIAMVGEGLHEPPPVRSYEQGDGFWRRKGQFALKAWALSTVHHWMTPHLGVYG